MRKTILTVFFLSVRKLGRPI